MGKNNLIKLLKSIEKITIIENSKEKVIYIKKV